MILLSSDAHEMGMYAFLTQKNKESLKNCVVLLSFFCSMLCGSFPNPDQQYQHIFWVWNVEMFVISFDDKSILLQYIKYKAISGR